MTEHFWCAKIFCCAMVRRRSKLLYEGRRALFGAPPLVSLRRRTKNGAPNAGIFDHFLGSDLGVKTFWCAGRFGAPKGGKVGSAGIGSRGVLWGLSEGVQGVKGGGLTSSGYWPRRRPGRIFFLGELIMQHDELMERLDRLTKAVESQAQAQVEATKAVKDLAEATWAVLNVLVTSLAEDAVDDAGMGEVLQYLGDRG